ncbi:MAG: DMT family transporter [Treponema sp.]|nr:DMT family transporter [Treponema sp.]
METVCSAGIVLAAAIWGFAFVIVKDSLAYVGAIWMIAIRFTIAALLLMLIYCRRLKCLNASYWKHGFILGTMIFLAYAFQTVGCDYTSAGKNAFLTAVYVICVPLISWPLYRKRPAWYVFMAAIIFFVGIGLVAVKEDGDSLLEMNIGDILTLVCGVFYGLHIIFIARYDESEDPVLLSAVQFLFTALWAWLASPFIANPAINRPLELNALLRPGVIFSMLYLGVLSTMVAYLLQNVCLKYVPSSLGSLFMSLEAVFGVVFGMIFLHEEVSPRMLLGFALIFAAIVMAEVFPKLRKGESSPIVTAPCR